MKNFNSAKIKLTIAIMGLLAAPSILVGCNTVEGVGTDIKHAGGALEHAAEDAKQPCPPTPPCDPRTRSQLRR
jgi:predicted small secreted protein